MFYATIGKKHNTGTSSLNPILVREVRMLRSCLKQPSSKTPPYLHCMCWEKKHLPSAVKSQTRVLGCEQTAGPSWLLMPLPTRSPGDELMTCAASECLWRIWSPCHIKESAIHHVILGTCPKAHRLMTPLTATASSAVRYLSVSASMFFFWYSKPSYAAPVATELLNLVNPHFLNKMSPSYLYFKKIVLFEIISIFCQHSIFFFFAARRINW